jgi:hypothetical protein
MRQEVNELPNRASIDDTSLQTETSFWILRLGFVLGFEIWIWDFDLKKITKK